MIVLHGGVHENQLLLWGETPAASMSGPATRRGRKSDVRRPKPLPYDGGAEGLSAALAAAACGFTVGKGDTETMTAWLPTVDGRPVASSPLIAEPPEASDKAVIAPWTVTALRLAPEQAIALLCSCVSRETLASGVIVGKTLAFWAAALRFAGALVARQQFLPGVKEARDPLPYRACWEPVVAGADAHRLAQLAQAMPHACRALTREVAAPPSQPAVSVLSAFLSEMVDHLVRSSMASTGRGFTHPPGRERSRHPAGRGASRITPALASVHDQWLQALRSLDGLMEGDAAELAQLAEQVREWRRPIALSTATPFRLCFRLEEPPDGSESDVGGAASVMSFMRSRSDIGRRPQGLSQLWYVRYLLQAVDDPSLFISAADAWTAKGRQASILKRGAFNPREYLLSALGQASRIHPPIEDSLQTAAPGGYELDVTGAHAFLTEKAWLLEQAGFGVLLPAWWTRKGTKLHLTARANVKSPTMQGRSGMSLDEIMRFNWQVALGDQTLSLRELETLAKLKAPLVKVRGQWVQLNAEEIQAALDFWKKQATGAATVRDIVQMALGSAKAPGGIAFEGVTATGWIAELLAQLEGRRAFAEMVVPDGFRGTLRPYQVRGYSWLAFLRRWSLGACLADDMGLGKTIQALTLIQRDWEANGRRPTLLICPMSVVGNWQKEAARFTPDLPVMVHHGLTRTKGPAFRKAAVKHALVLSSFALLYRDIEILKDVPWAGVILDEAQNIKNPQTKQAQAARSLKADYRMALTGTPVENHVGDLWSIMEFLNPGFLGTQAAFKRAFFVPIQANRDPDAAQRLKRLTGPFILRRLKTDKTIIADLPEKLEMKVFCTLTKEQASLYAAVVKDAADALDETEGIQRKGVVLATLSKLKQVCNHPAQFLGDNSAIPGRSGKLARLTEMLEEALSAGDRALVFTQFAEMGEIIRRHLQETFGREVLFLHGALPKKPRDRMVARFQSEDNGPRVFVLSLKAGGTGLNLTGANHVFHFDRWWNPAVENQATDRAFRIGQTRNVQVHKFLCVGTLEEKIDDMIERKQEVAATIVGSGEGWLTALSNRELKELFALRREALGE